MIAENCIGLTNDIRPKLFGVKFTHDFQLVKKRWYLAIHNTLICLYLDRFSRVRDATTN